MRNTLVSTVSKMAELDKSVMIVIDDTGFGAFEEFESKFPGQFVNVGIAEQQFLGFSAGLAMTGMKVIAYNVCSFLMRSMEQIRLELSYQKAPVVLVGVGGGMWYGAAGPTHHVVEDIASFRALPEMVIICPADTCEMELAVKAALQSGKPCYIRICKNNDPTLYTSLPQFEIGKAIIMKEGTDVALIATGGMVRDAIVTAELLAKQNIFARVISMHTIKPLDNAMVLECAENFPAIFTMEEHSVIGGLGGAVSEVLCKNMKKPLTFDIFGFPDNFAPVTGTRDYLNTLYRLDSESMAQRILSAINGKG